MKQNDITYIKGCLVIKCEGDHYHLGSSWGDPSTGGFMCEHETESYYDYVKINQLLEITDQKIIDEALSNDKF